MIGSLERLYRLTQGGQLRLREDPNGRIEVWVAERERFDDAPVQPLWAADPAVLASPAALDASGVAHRLVALIAPLVESHERNIELARETT